MIFFAMMSAGLGLLAMTAGIAFWDERKHDRELAERNRRRELAERNRRWAQGVGGLQADARLRAAAPELLEALELMLREYGCSCGESGCDMCNDSEIAREAIWKARGE